MRSVARPSSRGAVDDIVTHHISNPAFRFGASGSISRSSTSGRNSSLGFSHPTDHMYEDPSSKANSRGGSAKRKVVCIDGMCVDGQYMVPFDSQGETREMHRVGGNSAASLDPLSALSCELEELHSKPIQPAPKRRIVATNFCSGAQSKLDDAVNPFKRRSLPDSCGFRLHKPVARLPDGSQTGRALPVRQKVTQFCERCGSSNVQPNFMSSGNECLKAEVWGTRNVDEYSTDVSACSSSYKCFSCFHVTNC